MTLPYEEIWALNRTRDFLRYILTHRGRFTKAELRQRASRCLKHWPMRIEARYPDVCEHGDMREWCGKCKEDK